jgi:hypothetical protein
MMFRRRSPNYIPIVLALGLFALHAFSQSNERPKLKNFGSSLDRLKWNAERQATVETKRKDSQSKGSDLDEVVRVETSLVVSDVLVLDQQGRPVQGLTAKDFVLTEDGQTQSVGMFSLGDSVAVPRSIVLIIDYSCMQIPFLQTSVAAARTLIDKMGSLDRMAIVTDDIELLVNYTNNKRKLKDGLDVLLKRTPLVRHDPIAAADQNPRPPVGRGMPYSALLAVLKEAFDEEDVRPLLHWTQGGEAHVLKPVRQPQFPPA